MTETIARGRRPEDPQLPDQLAAAGWRLERDADGRWLALHELGLDVAPDYDPQLVLDYAHNIQVLLADMRQRRWTPRLDSGRLVARHKTHGQTAPHDRLEDLSRETLELERGPRPTPGPDEHRRAG